MSVRDDFTVRLGETWTYVVSCTDADGSAVSPATADWKLEELDGTTVLALTQISGIIIGVSTCTITVQTSNQSGVLPGAYRHRLKITDAGGAISRQVHGQIQVLADD